MAAAPLSPERAAASVLPPPARSPESGAHVTLCARTASEIDAAAAALREKGLAADTLALDVTDVAAFRAAIDAQRAVPCLRQQCRHQPAQSGDRCLGRGFRRGDEPQRPRGLFRGAVDLPPDDGGGRARLDHQHVVADGGMSAVRTARCIVRRKWAMEGSSKAMALDLAPHGIRVSALCPTFIETPMTRPFLQDEAFKASVVAKIKLGRLGRVEDPMGAIVFLASDASSLMTGSSLVIDGGWTAE